MSRFVTTIATLAAVGAALPGCAQVEKLDDGMGGPRIPAEVQRAFDDTCAVAACHDSGSRQGGLDLTATASPSIIGGMSTQSDLPLVELGNVPGSYLALKLLPNPPAGLRMPIGGDVESVDNAIILGWIAGATLPGGGGGGESEGGSTTDGGGQTTNPGTDEGSTGSDIKACGLADVAPTAPNPFDIGMNAGQIPPDVGEALTNNCGCHEVDEVIEGAFLYSGVVHFSTLAELHADYSIGGTDPLRSGVERLLERMESTELNRMPPPYYCDLGDGSEITDADRQLLIDWLTAGAPDAPTWMP